MVTKSNASLLLSKGESTLISSLTGSTAISVVTDGKALIQSQTAPTKREPYILLAECDCGRLRLSPKAKNMILVLYMPFEEASEEEFILYTRKLFRMYHQSGGILAEM